MTPRTAALLCAVAAAACGGPPPSDEEVQDGKVRVQRAVDAMKSPKDAVQLMGLVPTVPCGVARFGLLRAMLPVLKLKLGCADLSTTHQDAVETLALDFPRGCRVGDKALEGRATFRYVDQGSFGLEVDLTRLTVDDEPIPAKAGYEVCGETDHYFASAAARLPTTPASAFALDVSLKKKDGFPIIGGTTLTFDADETVWVGDAKERVTLTDVVYDTRDHFPKEGSLVIETPDGRRIEARFSEEHHAELAIDGKAPVTVAF